MQISQNRNNRLHTIEQQEPIETEFTPNPFEVRKHPKFPEIKYLRPEFSNFIKQFSLSCYKEIFNQIFKFSSFFESLEKSSEKIILNSLRTDIRFIDQLTSLKNFSNSIEKLGKQVREQFLTMTKTADFFNENEFNEDKNFLESTFIDDIDPSLDYFIDLLSSKNLKKYLLRPKKEKKLEFKHIQANVKREYLNEISSQIMPTNNSNRKYSQMSGGMEEGEPKALGKIIELDVIRKIMKLRGKKIFFKKIRNSYLYSNHNPCRPKS